MERKKTRPFQISCGLREGYDLTSLVHQIEEVRNNIGRWFKKRLSEGKKIAVGTLLQGEFIYPWNEGAEIQFRYEPAFHYKGMIREDASDEEADEILEDLARTLAQELKQKRVHVEFCNSYFVVET